MKEFKNGDLVEFKRRKPNVYLVVSVADKCILVKSDLGIQCIFTAEDMKHCEPKRKKYNHSSDLKDRDLKDLANMIQQFFNAKTRIESFNKMIGIKNFIKPILDDDCKKGAAK